MCVFAFFPEAVPKRILEFMNVPGLTRENVASHLQVIIISHWNLIIYYVFDYYSTRNNSDYWGM